MRIVSVTPLPVEADSRTMRMAASFAALGHDSIVAEGESSGGPARRDLPFELVELGGVGPLRRIGRRLPPADVYHLHSPARFPAVALRRGARAATLIYDAHDFHPLHQIGHGGLRAARRRAGAGLEARLIGAAEGFLTVSDGIAGLYEAHSGRRPDVVRNLQDPRLDQPAAGDIRAAAGVPDATFLIACVGNARAGVAAAQMIEALALLPGQVHVCFLGRGHEGLGRLAEAAGAGGRVHVLPPVPPRQVNRFIAAADLAALARTAPDDNWRFALPNAFFHAVSAGLPQLYPDLPEMAALAEAHGFGLPIDAADAGSIARQASRLVENPAELGRLRDAAVAAARELTWEAEEPRLGHALAMAVAA